MTGGRPCKGKVKHADERAATKALAELLEHDERHSTRMNVYRCPVCSSWHIGHARGLKADIAAALAEGSAATHTHRSRRNRRR